MLKKVKLTVFHVSRSLGMFALARRLTAARIRLLCYHGGNLGDEREYNPKLFCSSQTLTRRMAWMRKKGYTFTSLGQAVASAPSRAGRPALITAVTFDDGWYSTASEMIPVLDRLGIPSTLYLCTKHYLEGWAVPSVAVRYLLWKSGLAAVRLHGFGDADGDHPLRTPAQRNRSADQIVAAMEGVAHDHASMTAALERLAHLLQVPSAELGLASRRFAYINEEELQALPARGCTVELHGHVHHYPAGDPAAFRADLQTCSDTIVAAGLPAPRHYCYPSGNFDPAASDTLTRLGIASATTCSAGLIAEANPRQCHYLPRFLDGEDVTMLEFQAEMSGFSELLRQAVAVLRGRRAA
jgi:peptidoglycan/xylan/chitin deacetylase (PgdA/CDA1 family)